MREAICRQASTIAIVSGQSLSRHLIEADLRYDHLETFPRGLFASTAAPRLILLVIEGVDQIAIVPQLGRSLLMRAANLSETTLERVVLFHVKCRWKVVANDFGTSILIGILWHLRTLRCC